MIAKTIQQLNHQAGEAVAAQALHASRAQAAFLTARRAGLCQLGELARLQAELAGAGSSAVLFERAALEEFASGSLARCLGPEYAVFDNRRVARIPNGALLLIDRVLEIRGQRGHPEQPSEIVCEYAVPPDAWFYSDGAAEQTPYSILMEMALQPCGFLSAYLGTLLIRPQDDLYFRNLDGEARVLGAPDLRGQVVRAWARLNGHILDEETIIQKFDFRLEAGGRTFFEGRSVFGFFSAATMARQAGLDGGKESQPVFLDPARPRRADGYIDLLQPNRLSPGWAGLKPFGGRLRLLDDLYIDPSGGDSGQGYLYASRAIHPQDWYFANHFHQDPVMPGSLGVEAVLEALRGFVLERGQAGAFAGNWERARWVWPQEQPFTWKYRGQILPSAGQMSLEVHIRRVTQTPTQIEIAADASLWAAKVRIYHLKNITIGLTEKP